MNQKIIELYNHLHKIRKYEHALGLMYFDLDTICPAHSKETEGETINYFQNELFKLEHDSSLQDLIIDLYQNTESLNYLDQVLVKHKYENYLKTKNITPEMDAKYNEIYMQSRLDWVKAKEAKDYSLFKESFEKVVNAQKEMISLRENKLPNMYDNMLDDCEKGLLSQDLDSFFNELKEGLITLINKIKSSNHHIRTDFLNREVPIYKQEAFSRYLLQLNGFDFNKGVLATTEHPFTSDIAASDARVTTHYYQDMVLSNIYSIIHEGGHAIFMQNEPVEDHKHFINDLITNGMHESVSRFYENVIGRSKQYIHLIYPKFIEIFDEFKDITENELYEAINIVTPSLIRTEADEVTYGLHIVIRYEMEKMITNKEITFSDVPKKWNELYQKYLGVCPDDDACGVLQDVHWSDGFGYFPSYAIGNSYNIMYLNKLKKELDFENLIQEGKLEVIKNWLINNVFKEANHLTPKQWIKEITGEKLTPKYFLEYLNKKYSDIYHLK